MASKRIEIDVSSDIFDKVISFLEKLPKNKIKLNYTSTNKDIKRSDDIFSKTSGLLKNRKIDPVNWQNKIRNEWER